MLPKVLSTLFIAFFLFASTSFARDADPVIIKGNASLLGAPVDSLVGFKWDRGWKQVPIQIDERKTVDLRTLYPFESNTWLNDNTVVSREVYADQSTLTGADPDTSYDSNDELVFMSFDTGDRTDALEPEGVQKGSGVLIKTLDPLNKKDSYLYVFRRASNKLLPSAGRSYVDYDFDLTTPGATPLNYNFSDGPNPEDTFVETKKYKTHSSDRWIDDQVFIRNGISDPIDILDRDKYLFYPGYCGRSENTFTGYTSDIAEGTYVTNKAGAIRAIRSYLGANSGPYTQKEHIYYEGRQDTRIFLRVHAIPMVMAFSDYSPAADGMIYRNENNMAGVTIDGVPDTLTEGVNPATGSDGATWEQVTGPKGTLNTVSSFRTDIESVGFSNYYLDNSSPGSGAETQCTGDAHAYGSSGVRITTALPNTDPRSAGYKSLEAFKTTYYDRPDNSGAGAAVRRKNEVLNPIESSASYFKPKAAQISLRFKKISTNKKAKLLATVSSTKSLGLTQICFSSKAIYKKCLTRQSLGRGTNVFRISTGVKNRGKSRVKLTVKTRVDGKTVYKSVSKKIRV